MASSNHKFLNVLRLCNQAYGHYRFPVIVLAILSFVGSVLEGVGINSVIPLFSFVNTADRNAEVDAVSEKIRVFFNYVHVNYTLKHLLIFIVTLFIIKALVVFVTSYITSKTNTSYERNTRSTLFNLTLATDWPYLSQQRIGYLEQVLLTDVDNSTNFLALIITGMLTVANLSIYLLISINISPLITGFVFALGIIVFFIFKPFFYKNQVYSSQLAKLYKEVSHYINEAMLGIKMIKASGVQSSVKGKGDGYFDDVKNLKYKIVLMRNITNTFLQPIGLIFTMGIFAFFYKMTEFNVASFAVIVYAINKVFSYLQMAQTQLHSASALIPYVASVERYKEEARRNQEKNIEGDVFKFKDSLEFNDVVFSYVPTRTILSELNFSVKRGEMIGLIGPSGAGKTTVVDLLLRLYSPSSGEIRLDGESISMIAMDSWRKHIGYVSQDMFLINDSIENNIKFFGDVSEHDMIEAAKMANIYDFIKKLPDGFSTVIGERGVKLSGGERQRVVLARVLARKPEILILDEATSALDNESEMLIQRSIEGLKGKITVLAIAHRLSTVMAADRLIILNNGQIVEQGHPEELLKNKDSYFFKSYNVRS